MTPHSAKTSWLQATLCVAVLMACERSAHSEEPLPEPDPGATLRERYVALSGQMERSPIQEGLYLDSAESSHTARGDVYGVVDHSFAIVSETFMDPDNWCDALLLHINVKYCRASLRNGNPVLSMALGKKTEQPLKDTTRIDFTHRIAALRPDYTQIVLAARKGPLGTRNYDITLEFTALGTEQSLMHMHYEYSYGLIARLAMGFYFAGSGASKVGFTMIDGDKGKPPHLVGGVRGALERNTMRYYLALDAALSTLAIADAGERFGAMLEQWFIATERHARQLHEVDHDTYVEMKRREHSRQQQVLP